MDPDALVPGLPYEYSAITPAGPTIFAAGACPLDATGAVVAPGDVPAQAARAVDDLLAVLAHYGAGPADLVRTTIVVGTCHDLVAAWGVIAARIAPSRPPSTLLGVACLGYEVNSSRSTGSRRCPPNPRRFPVIVEPKPARRAA